MELLIIFLYHLFYLIFLCSFNLQNAETQRLNKLLKVTVSEWKIWDSNTDPQMWNLGFFLLCESRFLWKYPQVTQALISFKRQKTPQHFTWLKHRRINWLRGLRGRKCLQALAKMGKEIGSWGDSLFIVYFQISHLCFLL